MFTFLEKRKKNAQIGHAGISEDGFTLLMSLNIERGRSRKENKIRVRPIYP